MENETNQPEEEILETGKKSGNKFNIYLAAIIIVLLLGSFAFAYQKKSVQKKETAIKDNTEKFIKENLIQFIIIVLPGVNDNMLYIAVQRRHHAR